MPDWSKILQEIQTAGSTHDIIRRRYLQELHEVTGRNVIIYYSGWLQKPDVPQVKVQVNDTDKNGFMTVIHELDRQKGLDLILHTPGGEIPAAESLVHYLHEMFGTDIRAFVPDLALSAGTMIACACKEIFMGAHSSLGPTDPQVSGISAHGVIEDMLTGSTARLVNSVLIHPIEFIVAADKAHDLVILKSSGISAPPLPLGDSDIVRIGDTVYVTGNPKGYLGTFSVGYISAIQPGDVFVADKVFQMTAPISHGSSGGPVLNTDGKVIGIVSGGDTTGNDLNFASPVNYLKSLLATIR